ncbi:Smr/MutS family protein [Bartonella sp. A05]|uniref:Smr/MutS family protein n=1 Tax=Bartonella sp. A05 TaxID=2967261 RepID=UPI0022A8F46B|nr:Smr/MutS family protein [Bartonella sp. A05]MCZ2203428.1 Smr/MutS family protein [Bartonella sp. A05]
MARSEWGKKDDRLTPQDRFLWEMVCRTTIPLRDVFHPLIQENTENIDNKKMQAVRSIKFSQENQQKPIIVKEPKRLMAQKDKIHVFDRTTYRKIAKGHFPIEARLDLHGLMQEEAYFFLKKFLQSSQQSGLRYVLVITGRGRSYGSDGVLYQFVPYWLKTPIFRYYVHAFEPASRRHGGSGALYIRLRCLTSRKGV